MRSPLLIRAVTLTEGNLYCLVAVVRGQDGAAYKSAEAAVTSISIQACFFFFIYY